MRYFLLFLCTAFGVFFTPIASAQDDEAELKTYDELRDQGLLYAKRQKPKRAMIFLNKAYASEGGRTDFKTVFYRGEIAYELLRIDLAFQMLKEAEALAGEDPRNIKKTVRLRGELDGLYGGILVKPAVGETNVVGRIFLESQQGILNRQKRALFQSIRERFRATEVTLPTTIYLPHGDYTANNIPVSVRSGTIATADVYLQIDRRPDSGSGVAVNGWWIAGAGTAVAIATSIGAYFLFSEEQTRHVDRVLLERRAP